jgi:hypothetical protein
MKTILNEKWHGIAALIWSICGYLITVLVPKTFWESSLIVLSVWIFLGWLGPVFLLAISGSHRGNVVNRICAIAVLLIFIVFVV